ncbi:MAG: cytochrome c5 family protein [Betaproteobacteria bacterium]|nr:cytochrome c5 family protein [Betaproteobacteria bacterium]
MSEVHLEEHASPIKTPKQLIIVVLLAFLVPIILIVMLSQLVTTGFDASKNNPALSDEAIAARLKPVGQVEVVDPSAPKVDKSGKEIFEAACGACHTSGALNAPKTGDKAAWSKLIARGLPRLTQSAIKGIRQMPARGGSPDLSDIEIERAIVYMANQSGGKWIEPISKTAKPAERSGEQIVQAACANCHQTGVGGAPRIGDRAAWIPRATKGYDVVVRSAIKGHGGMPARGGMADLTDSELRSAVTYMFNVGAAETKTPQTATPAAPAVPAKADASKGKTVYEANCTSCHAAGVAGAPKAGDKAAWAPRLKSGMDTLYASSLKGKGAMPPKGGNLSLADADVKAAVDYLAGTAK